MDIDRLSRLLDLYFDEGLDADTKHELEEMLLASSLARSLFWERAQLNAHLRQQGQEGWGVEDVVSVDDTASEDIVRAAGPVARDDAAASFHRPLFRWLVAGLAASLMLVMIGQWVLHEVDGDLERFRVANVASDMGREPYGVEGTLVKQRDAWVAVLRKAVGVEWQNPIDAPVVGEPMKARRIQFDNGLIEIQTNRGALILLEGPADLEIVSDMEVRCQEGRLSVEVPPPAEGFLVHTPLVQVVDRGTAFAMDVKGDEKAEVHVIDGLVELTSPVSDSPMREVREGEAIRIASDGMFNDIRSASDAFPSSAEIDSRTKSAALEMRQAWRQRRDAIVDDPSCLVYFDFEKSRAVRSRYRDTIVPNHSKSADAGEHGVVVGCDWTDGRWRGKRALDFKNASDRVLFSVDGKHESLTCITSVRLGAMDRAYSSLLMSGDAIEGELQWQISQNRLDNSMGRLNLGRRLDSQWNSMDSFLSDAIIGPQRLGTWMQLAFVWDGKERICSQYIDGKLVSRDFTRTSVDSSFLSTGRLELGNWTPREGFSLSSPVRNFNGRMDEFVMFDRVFSDQEIQAFHDLKSAYWSGAESNEWGNPENWSAQILPVRGDDVYLDIPDQENVVFNSGSTEDLNRVILGSGTGRLGSLEISGGKILATKNPDRHTRVGVAGGVGEVWQHAGEVNLNSLQIGLDPSSHGLYRMTGGNLLLSRANNLTKCSLDVGPLYGDGTFEISGGELMTRRGVSLGRDEGRGVFSVIGDNASAIEIGTYKDGAGFWHQNAGSTLKVRVGESGLTRINIGGEAEGEGVDVRFANGALIDLGFVDNSIAGEWDVMHWDGELIDEGLQFGPEVNTDVWSFEFVDTDGSGSLDTLRVIAQP
ncbi:LamG-like jellyroll fold domain-containing protein [Rhodopirellula sallentina]|uniref:FecR protein domain protein n=1 Tax=Rhodopirellula sallentina SM41 TaxID=1263870 RepID=M5U5F9_9BACT|nr:LamG-like jellyroll fold domain-containing protein [Rhodopirellula sallentina]EMI56680.1 FecR protein domain protein [Rhodopirellula sallentina SM41]